ncbi:MAG: hypothetical protein ABS944_14135 [Solibacillus sp.]|uniref:hypothetical protein n=1 Tax=unclassified Solibacillus TaxID=2637870 RepID=UPI0030F7619D
MELQKRGYLLLLIGIILLILSVFVTVDWGFWAWSIVFFISLVLCAAGIIMLIINLFKQIKADKINKF